jgi:hypothetical protein
MLSAFKTQADMAAAWSYTSRPQLRIVARQPRLERAVALALLSGMRAPIGTRATTLKHHGTES